MLYHFEIFCSLLILIYNSNVNLKKLKLKLVYRLYGIFLFSRPMFVIKDPELLKQIFVKNFDCFSNRDPSLTKGADEIFAKTLLLLEGDSWRNMRKVM